MKSPRARDEHENGESDFRAQDEHADTRPDAASAREGQEHPALSLRPRVELEPGWVAANGLERNNSDELLALMLRPSFRPARELDLVPVAPCAHCRDGGLRTAGTVRTRQGRQLVRACDTCGAVVLSLWQPWQMDMPTRDG